MANEKPIQFSKWQSAIKARRATASAKDIEIRIQSLPLGRAASGKSALRLQRSDGRIDLVARGIAGMREYAPRVKTVTLKRRTDDARPQIVHRPFKPDHLALSPRPEKLSRELQRPYFIPGLKSKRNTGRPTSVFVPDTRYTFDDTSYPWSACGLVETPGGWGSGVMVGPQHLLTASHVVDWQPGNSAGWLKFTPLSFDGNPPFGVAWATLIYDWNKADPSDNIDSVECAFDYVVCILDSRIGDITGWMGSRGYSTDWDGGAYWGHVGYPGDMAGGSRPAFHGPGVMDSTFTESLGGRDSFGIRHRNDVWPGQSGGPFFGWWDGEVGPHVVSIQSAENWGGPSGPNTCGGGGPLPELVRWGLDHNP